jgi:hypothetical protein
MPWLKMWKMKAEGREQSTADRRWEVERVRG